MGALRVCAAAVAVAALVAGGCSTPGGSAEQRAREAFAFGGIAAPPSLRVVFAQYELFGFDPTYQVVATLPEAELGQLLAGSGLPGPPAAAPPGPVPVLLARHGAVPLGRQVWRVWQDNAVVGGAVLARSVSYSCDSGRCATLISLHGT